MGNLSDSGNGTWSIKCTTAFTTGKLEITNEQRAILIAIDLSILTANLCANVLSIYALMKSQQIKKRPSISLLVYLCLSDFSFAITAQTLFAVKIFHPDLPCLYDLIVEFSSSVLADFSLCLVVLIAISRYVHTRHMIRVKQIITHFRVNIACAFVFLLALAMSLVSLLADSNADVDVYLQTEIFQTFVGVVLIVLVVIIYRRTELIAKRRKATSKYISHFTAYSEKVLRKIMLSTLCTLLPLRIPFFCSTVAKAIISDKSGKRLTWWMQFAHLGAYALFCLSAGANAVIFLYNNKHASKLIRLRWDALLLCMGLHKRKGVAVRPIPDDITAPPLVQPVVTTGWYDRFVPTEAPTTLSTAVIGKKIWRDEKRRQRLKRKRRNIRRKKRLQEEKRQQKIKQTEQEAQLKKKQQPIRMQYGNDFPRAHLSDTEESCTAFVSENIPTSSGVRRLKTTIENKKRAIESHVISKLRPRTATVNDISTNMSQIEQLGEPPSDKTRKGKFVKFRLSIMKR